MKYFIFLILFAHPDAFANEKVVSQKVRQEIDERYRSTPQLQPETIALTKSNHKFYYRPGGKCSCGRPSYTCTKNVEHKLNHLKAQKKKAEDLSKGKLNALGDVVCGGCGGGAALYFIVEC